VQLASLPTLDSTSVFWVTLNSSKNDPFEIGRRKQRRFAFCVHSRAKRQFCSLSKALRTLPALLLEFKFMPKKATPIDAAADAAVAALAAVHASDAKKTKEVSQESIAALALAAVDSASAARVSRAAAAAAAQAVADIAHTDAQGASSTGVGSVDDASKTIFLCEHCGFVLSTASNLARHRRLHTNERPFACPSCPLAFTSSHHLKYHILSHTGELPHQCTHCEQRFKTSSSMAVHVRSRHTHEKPFACQVAGCTMAFTQAGDLSRHMRTHTGEVC
jgi:uncharacterized C2H2 Zn-finger protein